MGFPVFDFMPTASHWALEEEPGTVFFTPSYQIFTHINKIPFEPSLLQLNSLSYFSLSLYDRCSSLLNHLWDASLVSHSSTSISVSYWEAHIIIFIYLLWKIQLRLQKFLTHISKNKIE